MGPLLKGFDVRQRRKQEKKSVKTLMKQFNRNWANYSSTTADSGINVAKKRTQGEGIAPNWGSEAKIEPRTRTLN